MTFFQFDTSDHVVTIRISNNRRCVEQKAFHVFVTKQKTYARYGIKMSYKNHRV